MCDNSDNQRDGDQDAVFRVINRACGYLLNGIAWFGLTFNTPDPMYGVILGALLILFALALLVSTFVRKWTKWVDSKNSVISVILWPVTVISIGLALFLSIIGIGHYEVRVSILIYVVTAFLIVLLVSPVINIWRSKRIALIYKWGLSTIVSVALLYVLYAILMSVFLPESLPPPVPASENLSVTPSASAPSPSIEWAAVQAIGTWFTGLALAAFAGLTWLVSRRQQKNELDPDLICRIVNRYPQHGKRVFEDDNQIYDGIRWAVAVTNPGDVPVQVDGIDFGVEAPKTGRQPSILGLGGSTVFDEDGKAISEYGFFIGPKKEKRFALVLWDDETESELRDLIGLREIGALKGLPERNFKFYFRATWLSRGRERVAELKSDLFYLPQNMDFGRQLKPQV
jgi:hypothetical protein